MSYGDTHIFIQFYIIHTYDIIKRWHLNSSYNTNQIYKNILISSMFLNTYPDDDIMKEVETYSRRLTSCKMKNGGWLVSMVLYTHI
jgi:hypothetical protein